MELLQLPKFGKGVCLSRVSQALERLDIDSQWLSSASIAITGSNGKGSTSAALYSMASAHGLRVGLFTSPHLFDIRERFRVGEECVPLERLTRIEQRVLSVLDDAFGAFEAMFLVAVCLFAEAKCELCVFEAGIGGRFDPVRAANAKVAAVTSLDLEHTEILGETLEAICLEKSDICDDQGFIFYGENCRPFSELIRRHTAARGITPLLSGEDFFVRGIREDGGGVSFDLNDSKQVVSLRTPLWGEFQANNAALAMLALSKWLEKVGRKLSPELCRSGLLQMEWPGRLEEIKSDPPVVIDVGHSPDAIRAALSGLRLSRPGVDWVLVTGVSKNKKREEILKLLAPAFDTVVCTKAFHKGAEAAEILETFSGIDMTKEFYIAASISEAVSLSLTLAREQRKGVYVAGGLFLAAEYAWTLRGGNAEDLRFFG